MFYTLTHPLRFSLALETKGPFSPLAATALSFLLQSPPHLLEEEHRGKREIQTERERDRRRQRKEERVCEREREKERKRDKERERERERRTKHTQAHTKRKKKESEAERPSWLPISWQSRQEGGPNNEFVCKV